MIAAAIGFLWWLVSQCVALAKVVGVWLWFGRVVAVAAYWWRERA